MNFINKLTDIIPKFQILLKLSQKYNLKLLCSIAWVSESGYYKYQKNFKNSNTKVQKEKQDVEKIQNLVLQYKRKYGYRMINMMLQSKYKIIMNHKKVLRIMNTYDLLSDIRKKDPYSQIRKATQEHHTSSNILNREFRWIIPLQKLWTDITYIKFLWKWIYLSLVKDMVSWEVLSYKLSQDLSIEFVLETIKKLWKSKVEWALIHSDQGFHYTHPAFRKLLKKSWYLQSMSRKWNCLDNAPTESFFWHMKDEIDLNDCKTFQDVEKYMKNYIFHYNNHRPQWNRKKMTPVQYRNHLIFS